MKKVLIVMLFLLVTGVQSVYAENFSGNWIMEANGYNFILNLVQNGNSISGTMTAIDLNNPVSTIEGVVNGRKITFTRSNSQLTIPQSYEGYLYYNGKDAMAGIFSHNYAWDYGWHALKE